MLSTRPKPKSVVSSFVCYDTVICAIVLRIKFTELIHRHHCS